MRIIFLGPDGAGKSSVIAGLMDGFALAGLPVKMRHLKPRFVAQWRRQPITIVVEPHGKPMRGATASLVKITLWLFEEWFAYLFQERWGTLLLCDRYFHDLLVDPLRYRFGAPLWTAMLLGKLMPRPRLWVLLDVPSDILQERKQEVTRDETARQCRAYREFVVRQREFVMVDASQPLGAVIAESRRAIARTVLEGTGDDR